MSRNLPTTLIEPLCSPNWVAKAYSEYMYDCAAAQASLITAATEATLDESIDELSDTAMDAWTDGSDAIINLIASTEGEVKTITLNNLDDDEVIEQINYIENHTDDTRHDPMLAAIEHLAEHNDSMMEDLMDGELSWSQILNKYNNGYYIQDYVGMSSLLNNLANTLAASINIDPDNPVTLDEGWISFRSMIKCLALDAQGVFKDGYGTVLTKWNGAMTELKKLDSTIIFEQLKATLASATAWGAGFAAIAKDTVADRLAYFESQISTVIADTTERFANTVAVVKSKLANAANGVKDFFAMAADELGFSSIAEETFQTVDSSDVYAYTGASPLGAINTKGLVGLATATVKTVCAVGAGIFNAAKSILSRIWRKVSPFFKAITNDPVDIGVSNNKDDSYACSNFKSQGSITAYLDSDNNSLIAMRSAIQSKFNQWVALETYFGEINFRATDMMIPASGTPRIWGDFEYRPRCLNYRKAVELGLVSKKYYGGKTYVVLAPLVMQNLAAWDALLSTDLRPEDDEDERYVYMGFWLAHAMMQRMCYQTLYDITDWVEQENPEFLVPKITTWNGHEDERLNLADAKGAYYIGDSDEVVPDHVTNLDFIRITCGFMDHGSGVTSFDVFPSSFYNGFSSHESNDYYITASQVVSALLMIWVCQQVDRKNHPTEYLFVPYCNGTYDFSEGRYKIKTDAENANIASIIAQAAIAVVVIVAAVLICKKIVTMIKRKRIAKFSGKVGVMDNAMWNGKKLNKKEAWRYTKYKNKLAKLDGASSGLAGAGSKLSSLTDSVQKVQTLLVPGDSVAGVTSDNSILFLTKLIRG